MGDEEIIDAALRAAPEQRSSVVREACDDDETRAARLLALVGLAAATETEGGAMCPKVVEEGASLGRYVVQRHVGTGGMGSVYAAYDAKLDRRVALKVLHSAMGWRIEREARLLARVEHPNVVGVYDAGVLDGVGFISMEFVEGTTLRHWLETPRTWRDAVEVLVAAGRGLQAVHDVGVIHRDFKPENVLLSASDRRVAVTDFGIARLAGASHFVTAETDDSDIHKGVEHSDTIKGGTPAYMAPEQWCGAPVDRRTDVFAFCVVLYEALFQRRPFPGPLGSGVGESATLPSSPRVPGWLARTVLRGLSLEPDQRWSSMETLLDRLDRQRRRHRARGALAVGALVTLTGLSGHRLAEMHAVDACDRESRSIEQVWNAERETQLRGAFEWRALPYGTEAADGVVTKLDAWTDGWIEERNDACLAAEEHSDSASTLACLDERRTRFSALVDLLVSPDDEIVQHAVAAAASLPTPQSCLELNGATAIGSSKELLEGLARASAEYSARRLEPAVLTAQALSKQARRAGDATVALEAELLTGLAQSRSGEFEAARQTLQAVFDEAGGDGADDLALRAVTRLVLVEGVLLAKPERGRLWLDVAEVLATRLELEDGLALARLHHARGQLALEVGDFEGALTGLETGASLAAEALGEDHPVALELASALAGAHHRHGDHDEAAAIHARVLAHQEALLGGYHPDVAQEVANLAAVHFERGEYERAREEFERVVAIESAAFGDSAVALAGDLEYLGLIHTRLGNYGAARKAHDRALRIRLRAYGEDHPKVAASLHHIGFLDYQLADFEAAVAGHLRALAIVERIHGPEHPDIPGLLSGVGAAYNAMGDAEQALAAYRRALKIASRVFGVDHVHVGILRHNLGVALYKLGRADESLPELEAALAIAGEAWGAEHPRLTELHRSRANTLFELGRLDDAISASEHAVQLADKAGAPPLELARARFRLALQLERAGGDRKRALELARQALSTFEGLDATEQIAEVTTWMNDTDQCERCTKRPGRSRPRSSVDE